ncbi:uncharacterized protein LOC109804039 [Cajanus cajan]|uniref:uncharacterized protein LOC109804039 n=1 Tax=Cajanus cajan TaxID=3821 RepID=UPI00098DCE0F|nr:uncharacterized protein LOC109804039 [Cajanus cajan]XP_020221383.1 uncharacterized protein LOC109804039 [Cajanus cajan]XP_020221391.1 uncharacterized protein LOC109804039 [Cajanus cajan]XP_029127257.1 uncharacterized protein LOC109804039 [Cajanus cajan]
MGSKQVPIDLDDYDVGQNLKGPGSEDYRLERRWKRRELSNKRLKPYDFDSDTRSSVKSKRLKPCNFDSATRSSVKSCGNVISLTKKNVHMPEDEMDEDYKAFLVNYKPDIDVVSDDSNIDGSNNDINIGRNSDHDDHSDSDYRTFLDNCREIKRLQNESRLDTENVKGLNQRDETGNQGSDLVRRQTSAPMKSQQNLEGKRGSSKKKPREDISGVPRSNDNCYSELDDVDEDYQTYLNSCCREDDEMPTELIQKRSSVVQNSQVSDHAYVTPEMLSDVDEDYQQYLNSIRIVDGEVECTPERNDDDDSNSSNSDLIVLEANQIHENTPFVSSKAYDPSWFQTEKNPRDNWQLSGKAHSQFRRRLMNDLQRPYDQEECNRLLHEVRQKRQKERHIETRRGVVKSYHTKGVNKSYLEMYPDLAKALVQFKQPERVLFLLRGFIFWLQNLTHEGIFQPWLDQLCLERLRKM